MSHTYEVLDPKDAEVLKTSARGKDDRGNNIYHEIFKLEKNKRNKFLELILDEKYFLKILVKPFEKKCCKRINKVVLEEIQPELYAIGDIGKRNKDSIEPSELEHEQPI